MASRMRCDMNHADLRVIPSERCSWFEEIPFLLLATRKIACSQTFIGMWLSSKMLPTLTVNGLRQSLHLYTPIRVDLPRSLVLFPITPHFGHTGPRGQSRASTKAYAASSLW